jgi:hypothetical protein
MKYFSTLSLLLFLFSVSSVRAQNWAPFRFDKKVLYTCSGNIGRVVQGEYFNLVQFDSLISGGDSVIRYYSKGFGNRADFFDIEYERNPSVISIFGKKIVQKGSDYFFPAYEVTSTQPAHSLCYRSAANLGDTIIRSENFYGIVIEKNATLTLGQPDSVKRILLKDTGNFQTPDTIVLSKIEGFLQFPCVQYLESFNGIYTRFKRFGLWDNNFKNIQILPVPILKYQPGDVVHSIGSTYYLNNWQNAHTDSMRSAIASVWADSCQILDTGFVKYDSSLIPYGFTQIRKTRNEPNNMMYYSGTFQDTIQLGDFNGNGACVFMTIDSILYKGFGTYSEYYALNLLSTELPTKMYINASGGVGGTSLFDMYFRRGNSSFGSPLLFAKAQPRVSSRPIFNLYPNPAKTNVSFSFPGHRTTRIRILNSMGMEILNRIQEDGQGLDIESYPKGIYFIQLPEFPFSASQRLLLE